MNNILACLIVITATVYLLLSMIGLLESDYGLACLNPIHNRWKYNSLNWFGVIVVTIFFNIILLPYVPFYWFYKLMTVKRKDK